MKQTKKLNCFQYHLIFRQLRLPRVHQDVARADPVDAVQVQGRLDQDQGQGQGRHGEQGKVQFHGHRPW